MKRGGGRVISAVRNVLQWSQLLHSSGGQRSKMGLSGLNSKCQQSRVPSGGSRGGPILLSFPDPKGHLGPSADGLVPPSSKPTVVGWALPGLPSLLPPSPTSPFHF